MSHPILFNASLGLGLMLVALGINAALRPNAHLTSLKFPIYSEPQLQSLNHALMRIWGIRNISFGLLLSAIWASGNETLMGIGLCISIALLITDGFVSRMLIGGGETQHWVFPPILALMAAGLLGWF